MLKHPILNKITEFVNYMSTIGKGPTNSGCYQSFCIQDPLSYVKNRISFNRILGNYKSNIKVKLHSPSEEKLELDYNKNKFLFENILAKINENTFLYCTSRNQHVHSKTAFSTT